MRRALLGTLVAGATVAVALLALMSGSDTQTVRAEFANADGLRPGSLVRVSGAKVGTVSGLHVTPRNTAVVTLHVDRGIRLGTGAAAAIRPANLLGEKFVDLTQGDRARPLTAARIALSATSTPVELDDVLDVLDPTTRGRLGILIGEAGVALGDRGADLSSALRALPGTVGDADRLVSQLGADTSVLERLLTDADAVSARVARDRIPLGQLVDAGDRALTATAEHRAGLAKLLDATPGALGQLRTTLRKLDRAGAGLRPAARGLQATAAPLHQALASLPGFAHDASPALDAVTASAPSLTRLGREAAPVVRRLRPTVQSLGAFLTDAEPLTRAMGGSIADLLSVAQNWALAIQTRDAASHVFRVSLSLTPDLARGLTRYVRGARSGPRAPARAPALPDSIVSASPKRDPATPSAAKASPKAVQKSAADLQPVLDFLLKP